MTILLIDFDQKYYKMYKDCIFMHLTKEKYTLKERNNRLNAVKEIIKNNRTDNKETVMEMLAKAG